MKFKNLKSKAAAAVALMGLTATNAFAAMTFDPAAAITTTQTAYEGYADTIMTFLWTAGPIIMLGFVAWSLLKRGVKSAK
jgi:hypothetical protein